MAKKQELKAVISADAQQFYKTVKRVGAVAGQAAKYLAGLGVAGGVFSVREALRFSKGMAEVRTILKLSDAEFNRLKVDVRGVAKELGLSMPDAVAATYQAISSGVPKDNVIDFLRTAGKSAIAGVTDVATAVDGLTTVMNSYGIEAKDAERVSDLMFTVVKDGKINFKELSDTIGRAAPMAKASGTAMEEMAAAVATLAKIEKPEQAITDLNAVMVEAATAGTPLLKFIAQFKGKTLSEIIGAGLNRRAAAGMAILAGNATVLATELDNMKTSTGATNDAFDIMGADASFAVSQLRTQIQDMGVAIGTELLPQVVELSQAFTAWLANKDNLDGIVGSVQNLADLMSRLREDASFVFGFLGKAGQGIANVTGNLEESRQKRIARNFGGMAATTTGGALEATGGAADALQIAALKRLGDKGIDTQRSDAAFLALLFLETQQMRKELQGKGETGGLPTAKAA